MIHQFISGYQKLSYNTIRKVQSGGSLGRPLGPLLKTGLPFMKNIIKQLAKSVLISLELTTAVWEADAGIHKKILVSGTTALIISNEEMEGIMKIVKSVEDSSFLLKQVSGTIQNEAKEQNDNFLVCY